MVQIKKGVKEVFSSPTAGLTSCRVSVSSSSTEAVKCKPLQPTAAQDKYIKNKIKIMNKNM